MWNLTNQPGSNDAITTVVQLYAAPPHVPTTGALYQASAASAKKYCKMRPVIAPVMCDQAVVYKG
jgi:hypothetical protein